MAQRQHYLTLDALRGVAAFAVMIFHQQRGAVMGHGYLAVDFNFLLSGFVIAKAYKHKLLSGMRFSGFALVRIARLYPLLIAATLVAAGYMAMSSVRGGHDLHWLTLLLAALLALPDPSGTFAPDPFPLLRWCGHCSSNCSQTSPTVRALSGFRREGLSPFFLAPRCY